VTWPGNNQGGRCPPYRAVVSFHIISVVHLWLGGVVLPGPVVVRVGLVAGRAGTVLPGVGGHAMLGDVGESRGVSSIAPPNLALQRTPAAVAVPVI
jgi:hypothetical protein